MRPRGDKQGATEERVLMFIRVFIRNHGYAPTVREIGEGLGLASTSAVFHHLTNLRQKEMVTWRPATARTLSLTTHGEQACERITL